MVLVQYISMINEPVSLKMIPKSSLHTLSADGDSLNFLEGVEPARFHRFDSFCFGFRIMNPHFIPSDNIAQNLFSSWMK